MKWWCSLGKDWKFKSAHQGAIYEALIHGNRSDFCVVTQVGDGLPDNFFSKIYISNLNGGKTHGYRKAAVWVPNRPYFETKTIS